MGSQSVHVGFGTRYGSHIVFAYESHLRSICKLKKRVCLPANISFFPFKTCASFYANQYPVPTIKCVISVWNVALVNTHRYSGLMVSVWQVQFPSPFVLTGVVTRGRAGASQWVKSFKVGYSSDCDSWQFVSNSTGHAQVSQPLVEDTIKCSYLCLSKHYISVLCILLVSHLYYTCIVLL